MSRADDDIVATSPERPTRAKIVGQISALLADENFGTGPLAELRRIKLGYPLNQPSLHRLLARHVPEEWLHGPALQSWALVIHCLALAARDNLFGQLRLGSAFHQAGFGEKRLVNLLDATPIELLDRLPRAVRFVVSQGERLHGPQLADLVLIPLDGDSGRYEALRQSVAADYYRAEFKANQPVVTVDA